MSEINSFHNDPLQKEKYVSMYRAAREDNKLIRGRYFCSYSQRGCLVGIPTHGSHHARLARDTGLDEWIIRMGEKIFENLPEDKYLKFPERLFISIPIGLTKKDTDIIRAKILYFILTEILPKKYQKIKAAANIISMFEDSIKGIVITSEQWRTAANAANAAAAAAAYAVADADYAVADTAYAVAAAYAAAAAAYAGTPSFEKIENKFIELFENVGCE